MTACGIRATHRDSGPCELPEGHEGHHSWDARHAAVWTPERIEERLRAWAAGHGGYAPRYEDWHPGGSALHEDWRKGEWPSSFAVVRRLGKRWTEVLADHGLEPRPRKVPPAAYHGPCERCGAPLPNAKAVFCSHRCEALTKREACDRRVERIIELRRSGWLNHEIATELGTSHNAIANALSHAKRRGVDVPRSPYWFRRAHE